MTMRFEGWSITGWAAAAMAVLVVLCVATLGASEAAAREVVRWSVRLGAVTFAAAFVARPLHQLLGRLATKWLLRNRRYVGVSFAVMHFTHLGGLVVLAVAFPAYYSEPPDALTLYVGGSLYVLLAAMTATSFDRTAAWIGRTAWKRLHTVGAFGLWGVLTLNYTGAATQDLRFLPLSLLLLAAMAVRIRARLAGRARGAVATSG